MVHMYVHMYVRRYGLMYVVEICNQDACLVPREYTVSYHMTCSRVV